MEAALDRDNSSNTAELAAPVVTSLAATSCHQNTPAEMDSPHDTWPLFAGIDRQFIEEVCAKAEHCTFEKGAVIGDEDSKDQRLHLITKGVVDLIAIAPDRETITVEKVGIGAFFGECEILSSHPEIVAVKATTSVETIALSRAQLADLFAKKPEAGFEVAKSLSDRMSSAQAAIDRHASQNVNQISDQEMTFGEKVADRFAATMGSWGFIICQSMALAGWIGINCVATAFRWDPYPFICLNLLLSFQAAYAAPIIMMSQNRQAEKDRLAADVDHQVNVHNEETLHAVLERLERLEAKGSKE